MSTVVLDPAPPAAPPAPKPLTEGDQSRVGIVALWAFVVAPFVALAAAIPLAWGWGLSWLDVTMFVVLYLIGGHGIGTGFHRYLTHGSFKAKRPLRIGLALAGSFAIEGPVIQWVADHRRHHAFSDVEGDPHSPWRYGETVRGLIKGLFFAHIGWMFNRELSNRDRFAPDLLADRDLRRIDMMFPAVMVTSLLLPAVIGGLASWSWQGALTGFLWAGLIRIGLTHHVTWAINSVCHVYGERPFATRDGDRATNFWPLAALSLGESWHNLHHADPTCARHGVLRGQIDANARLIWIFEKLGWATNVRWPKSDRLEAKRIT